MSEAKKGDLVKIHYTGTLENGTEFDSSKGREPLQFEIGAGQVIPGFEQGVIGMKPGESKSINIPMEKAYGVYDEEKLLEIDKADFGEDFDFKIGQQLQITDADGIQVIVRVTEVTEKTVTLDSNHPLAGKNLIFKLDLVEIV